MLSAAIAGVVIENALFRESAILPHETTARMSGILRFAAAIPARGNGRGVKSASIAWPRQARRLRYRYESVARRPTNRGHDVLEQNAQCLKHPRTLRFGENEAARCRGELRAGGRGSLLRCT
jgi:hypothetical protein